jgi:large subunit ribosomal protein L18
MKLVNKRKKRKQRKLRSKPIRGNLTRPRLVLSKSNRYLTAQVIDDEKGQTLIYLCTANLNEEETKLSYCCKNKE